ncbi:MAG: DUF2156 domain-containing protein [Lachnospiraceae bacterium]|nr:DUF2156 domain-containing protein [Lachnospiraceae bacterium]
MIEWKTPELSDVPEMRRLAGESGSQGSDSSAVNIFLLREKYNIRISFCDGMLYRLYTGNRMPGRAGLTFPLGPDVEKGMAKIREDCEERGKAPCFIFLTEEQRSIVADFFPDMVFDTSDGNYDYTYTAEHLAHLAGKDNEKKRNRVNRFCRLYPDWEIRYLDRNACSLRLSDMITIEQRWFADQQERPDSTFLERIEIYETCKYWKELDMIGAIIYSGDDPVAMTMASEISPGCFDIHFEKCYGEYAHAGGFSAINKFFAEHLLTKYGAKWINREEDIGLEGLRKAKMAYRPDLLLKKYHTMKE